MSTRGTRGGRARPDDLGSATRPVTLPAADTTGSLESGRGPPGAPAKATPGPGTGSPTPGVRGPGAPRRNPARAGLTRRREAWRPARAQPGMGSPRGAWGLFAASPPARDRCPRRVRQRQSAAAAENSRRTPRGQVKFHLLFVFPVRPRPPPVSQPPLQSRQRHQRRRAASSAAQPADPSKVTATSGSAGSAPDCLLGRPPSAIQGNWRRRERKGEPHSPPGSGAAGRPAPPPAGAVTPPPPRHSSPDSRCSRPRKPAE